MKQELILKRKEVVLEKPTTLRSVLEEEMLEKGIDLGTIEVVANHLIISIDGTMSMTRNLDTEIKEGQKVELIPAKKAG